MQVPYLAGPRPDAGLIIARRLFGKASWKSDMLLFRLEGIFSESSVIDRPT